MNTPQTTDNSPNIYVYIYIIGALIFCHLCCLINSFKPFCVLDRKSKLLLHLMIALVRRKIDAIETGWEGGRREGSRQGEMGGRKMGEIDWREGRWER